MNSEFAKEGGNLFYKYLATGQRIEINLLLSRTGSAPGLRPKMVDGVGQVDTLPELSFAMLQPPLVLNVRAHLSDREVIEYQAKIPDVEAAVVLKAHSWNARRAAKDVSDLHSLLEIREAYPTTSWKLDADDPIGFRKDTVRTLKDLSRQIIRKNAAFSIPDHLDRLRFAALVEKHIASPP